MRTISRPGSGRRSPASWRARRSGPSMPRSSGSHPATFRCRITQAARRGPAGRVAHRRRRRTPAVRVGSTGRVGDRRAAVSENVLSLGARIGYLIAWSSPANGGPVRAVMDPLDVSPSRGLHEETTRRTYAARRGDVGVTAQGQAAPTTSAQSSARFRRWELGIFGQYTKLDDKLKMDNVPGIGGSLSTLSTSGSASKADIAVRSRPSRNGRPVQRHQVSARIVAWAR